MTTAMQGTTCRDAQFEKGRLRVRQGRVAAWDPIQSLFYSVYDHWHAMPRHQTQTAT